MPLRVRRVVSWLRDAWIPILAVALAIGSLVVAFNFPYPRNAACEALQAGRQPPPEERCD